MRWVNVLDDVLTRHYQWLKQHAAESTSDDNFIFVTCGDYDLKRSLPEDPNCDYEKVHDCYKRWTAHRTNKCMQALSHIRHANHHGSILNNGAFKVQLAVLRTKGTPRDRAIRFADSAERSCILEMIPQT